MTPGNSREKGEWVASDRQCAPVVFHSIASGNVPQNAPQAIKPTRARTGRKNAGNEAHNAPAKIWVIFCRNLSLPDLALNCVISNGIRLDPG